MEATVVLQVNMASQEKGALAVQEETQLNGENPDCLS
jgi:hypothetical protein